MKTFTKLSLLAVAASMLVGCGLNRPDGDPNKAKPQPWGPTNESKEPYSYPEFDPYADGYSEPEPASSEAFPRYEMPDPYIEPEPTRPNVQPDEWQGYTPLDPNITVPDPSAARTPYSVTEDLCKLLLGDQLESLDELLETGQASELDDGSGYYAYIGLGTGDSSYLIPFMNMIVSDYFPDYLEALQAGQSIDYDGYDGYYIPFITDDETIIVEAITNLYGSNRLYIDYYVYWAD